MLELGDGGENSPSVVKWSSMLVLHFSHVRPLHLHYAKVLKSLTMVDIFSASGLLALRIIAVLFC